MKRLSVLAVILLGSCASPPPYSAVMPDGRTAVMTYCDGVNASMASCFNSAAKICGGKYEVVSKTETGGLPPRREMAFICER